MATYSKTGSVTYSVITDTHGYPNGYMTADINLGDDTPTTKDAYLGDMVVPFSNWLYVLGNHDMAYNGNQQKGIRFSTDTGHKVALIGFDSCKNFEEFEIPLAEIKEAAERMEALAPDWDILVATHIPLFDSAGQCGECWKGNRPVNTDELLKLLKAYRDHSTCTISGTTYSFKNQTGHVIGCFAGHVHNQIIYIKDNIYMETFYPNGGDYWDPFGSKHNCGLYQPAHNTIEINFTNKTVNGYSFVSEVDRFDVYKGEPPANYYSSQTLGWFKIHPSSSLGAYPKFMSDGTYLGYSSSASGGATENGTGVWNFYGSNNVTVNGTVQSVNFIGFSGDGLLCRMGTSSSSMQKIPNYQTATISFVSNGILWRFVNGKYQHDRAQNYKFMSSSGSYAVFDGQGYYLGWSNSAGGLLTGVRDSSTASRCFNFSTASIYENNVKVADATQIIWDTDGKLLSFLTTSGSYYYVKASSTVTFTANGRQWTFRNRAFVSVV